VSTHLAAPEGTDLDVITIAEFAASMRVCERTVERRIRLRKYPVVVIAGKRRVPRAWVRDLIAEAIATGSVTAEDHGSAWIAAHTPSAPLAVAP
jgi:hypothetical protein